MHSDVDDAKPWVALIRTRIRVLWIELACLLQMTKDLESRSILTRSVPSCALPAGQVRRRYALRRNEGWHAHKANGDVCTRKYSNRYAKIALVTTHDYSTVPYPCTFYLLKRASVVTVDCMLSRKLPAQTGKAPASSSFGHTHTLTRSAHRDSRWLPGVSAGTLRHPRHI